MGADQPPSQNTGSRKGSKPIAGLEFFKCRDSSQESSVSVSLGIPT